MVSWIHERDIEKNHRLDYFLVVCNFVYTADHTLQILISPTMGVFWSKIIRSNDISVEFIFDYIIINMVESSRIKSNSYMLLTLFTI